MPDIELVPVERQDATVLSNLFELYAHDFSEFMPFEVGDDGRFGVAEGSEWWEDPSSAALFIKADRKFAGFAILHRGSRVTHAPEVMDVAEFFVLRRWRRQGVGTLAAHALFRRHPGTWEVRVRESSPVALSFWPHAIRSFTGEDCRGEAWQAKQSSWQVFRFTWQAS
jgi:predicted acetyltransferase